MWTNGHVKVTVSSTGRRTFYTRQQQQRAAGSRIGGGGEKGKEWVRSTKREIREQYPDMRLPSSRMIMLERSAGRNIDVTIENNTGKTLFLAFYDRNGSYLERRLISSTSIGDSSVAVAVKGPRWKWTTRQYMVVAFESGHFPAVARLESFGSRAARIGFNVGSGKNFLVSGDSPETLQFD